MPLCIYSLSLYRERGGMAGTLDTDKELCCCRCGGGVSKGEKACMQELLVALKAVLCRYNHQQTMGLPLDLSQCWCCPVHLFVHLSRAAGVLLWLWVGVLAQLLLEP